MSAATGWCIVVDHLHPSIVEMAMGRISKASLAHRRFLLEAFCPSEVGEMPAFASLILVLKGVDRKGADAVDLLLKKDVKSLVAPSDEACHEETYAELEPPVVRLCSKSQTQMTRAAAFRIAVWWECEALHTMHPVAVASGVDCGAVAKCRVRQRQPDKRPQINARVLQGRNENVGGP
eukprot:CAMPEP_0169107368 /NCGR_PEP_ID=MMETSP1015-20121227/24850_1 /TAXON_ID=342587 /ORGANISM="Karlodinium micrum, Strain CCMP2283" /LENGTH=177 /DNA_ID=CAMNT_0009168905 /DNA_START=621 /DNA_END=1156 /DNA_ORIENTATION=-